MTLAARLEAVRTAERGHQIGAFFDFDGTLITGYSAQSFMLHRMRHLEMGVEEFTRTLLASVRGVNTPDQFEDLLRTSLRGWEGWTVDDLTALGERLFRDVIASQIHTETWQLVQAHRAMGHTVVIASSATRFQVAPMAAAVDADRILVTEMDDVDGVLTGDIRGAILWGDGKLKAVRSFADEHTIDLARSFAYTNGGEDIPLLKAVGNPCAVSPDKILEAEAQERHWPILSCRPRGGTPRVESLVRTAGFWSGFGVTLAAGLSAGLLNRSRKTLLEVAGGAGADIGLALGGVDVEVVQGAEHLWGHRPCVFIFNHQSNMDTVVVMKLLRAGYTGVAKIEAKKIPGFGQLFQAMGVAFVDRGNTRQARDVLAPAVDKIRDEGLSLALSPEGTRSATPKLGRFKKGAFHIAMQADVPLVPIVIRGAGEVQWRGSRTISPGRIEVVVLPPISPRTWTVDTLDNTVAGVRDIFVHTLENWPQAGTSNE